MNCLKQILIVFASLVLTAAACEPEKAGYNLPVPKPVVTPEIPGQPDPEDPVDPVDPPAPPVDSARLARIGQIPVIEVYFTEYTKPELFPTLDDIRCFTHVNVGHGRFANKQTGDGGIVIEDKGYLKRIVAYKQDYPELKVKLMIGGWGKNADGSLNVPDGGSWTFISSGELPLTDYIGQTIYIAFKYTSSATASATWEVKNVLVHELDAED